tara:strand:- start:85 stop:909 length:825 start_codon:yes stop_codon:yes gene_type:complete
MKYNEYNFKITNELEKKIFSLLRITNINKIFLNKNIQKEFKKKNKKDLEKLFIKNTELIINGLVKTYFYYNNLKKNKKIKNKLIQSKIHKRINNLFGKSNLSDIKILIFIYENIINKINFGDIINFLIENTKNFKLKGGGFFSSDPDFPQPNMTFFQKLKTYIPILWYLENKWPWIEWVFMVLDVALDLAGMIPGVGIIPDIVGLIVSILRKDWIGSIITLIQIIPAVGIFAGPIGVLRTIIKGYDKVNEVKEKYNTAKEIYHTSKELVQIARE